MSILVGPIHVLGSAFIERLAFLVVAIGIIETVKDTAELNEMSEVVRSFQGLQTDDAKYSRPTVVRPLR